MAARAAGVGPDSPGRGARPGATIVFVDDELDELRAFERVVAQRIPDARVVTFDSAPAALEALGALQPDVVVSDFRMPGMDGLRLLAEVKRRQPGAARIVFTAYAEADLARRAAEEAQVDVFLSKDVPAERLAEVVRSYLRRPVQDRLATR